MKVAILGAGISGLAAGRFLHQLGVEAILFERSEAPGGRVATQTLGEFTFDVGAQSVVPYASELAGVMTNELPGKDLISITAPVYVHHHLRVTAGDPKHSSPRYTYRQGNIELARLLADGLTVRYDTAVSELARDDHAYVVAGESFDALILTMPVPQASLLLWGLGIRKSTAASRYRSCLSVQLGFAQPPPTDRYHALIDPEGAHPLQWLSLENIKCPDRAPVGSTGIVAQLSPGFSRTAWEWEDSRIVAETCGYLNTLFGSSWTRPTVSSVKRWKYSQPETLSLFETVNHVGDTVILAGDGVAGGRIEYAFASGLRAARMLVQQP